MIQKKRTLKHFGITKKGTYRGFLHDMYIQDIKDCINEQQMCALVGISGSGKNTIFDLLYSDYRKSLDDKHKFVFVENTNLERLTINNITDAIIYDLSSETPKRSMEARSRQVRRILGEASINRDEKVCVVIDSADRLSSQTVLALKNLHEKKYLGHGPLFSILLIGQPKLVSLLANRKEVFWRFMIMDLQYKYSSWMNYKERIKYLERVFGQAITPEARERIATQTRVPLEMEFFVNEKMEAAKTAGKKQIDAEVVELTIKQRREALGLSKADLAKAAGIGKTTVHDIENNKQSTKKEDVEAALEKLEAAPKANTQQRKTA